MTTFDFQTQYAQALEHRCPLCGADPGQDCQKRTGSGATDPHRRRLKLTEPAQPEPERRQSLCCECGQLRTISGNYNARYRDPNYSDGGLSDKRGWRNTGTLKCDNCRKQTRHALIGGSGSDWNERAQAFILGGERPNEYWDDPYRNQLRTKYFAQFPLNPHLNHRYWTQEAKDAFDAGEKTITAVCGAPIELDFDPHRPSNPSKPSTNELVKPDRIDWDTEFEDTETSMWWVDMDCVNCLAVSNRIRLKRQRDAVLKQLLEVTAVVETMDAPAVAKLAEYLDDLIGGTDE